MSACVHTCTRHIRRMHAVQHVLKTHMSALKTSCLRQDTTANFSLCEGHACTKMASVETYKANSQQTNRNCWRSKQAQRAEPHFRSLKLRFCDGYMVRATSRSKVITVVLVFVTLGI